MSVVFDGRELTDQPPVEVAGDFRTAALAVAEETLPGFQPQLILGDLAAQQVAGSLRGADLGQQVVPDGAPDVDAAEIRYFELAGRGVAEGRPVFQRGVDVLRRSCARFDERKDLTSDALLDAVGDQPGMSFRTRMVFLPAPLSSASTRARSVSAMLPKSDSSTSGTRCAGLYQWQTMQ